MSDALYQSASAYSFFTILSTDNIGDSLNNLNSNYSTLDSWVADFQQNYENVWSSIVSFYTTHLKDMDDTISFTQNYSGNVIDMVNTIENNYSKWSAPPMTRIYPEILPAPFNQDSITKITKWMNDTFSVQNTETSTSNYFQNQTAIVSCYVYRIFQNNSSDTQSRTTTCTTADSVVYIDCSTTWSGTVYCHQGKFGCGYTSNCTNKSNLICSFKDSPYALENSSGTVATSKITADINYTYSDRYEDNSIKTLLFTVLDCNWVFTKFIVS